MRFFLYYLFKVYEFLLFFFTFMDFSGDPLISMHYKWINIEKTGELVEHLRMFFEQWQLWTAIAFRNINSITHQSFHEFDSLYGPSITISYLDMNWIPMWQFVHHNKGRMKFVIIRFITINLYRSCIIHQLLSNFNDIAKVRAIIWIMSFCSPIQKPLSNIFRR
jgi:hypothetical protein